MKLFPFDKIDVRTRPRIEAKIATQPFEHRFLKGLLDQLDGEPSGYIKNGFILEYEKNSWIIGIQTEIQDFEDPHDFLIYGSNWKSNELGRICSRLRNTLPNTPTDMHFRGTKKLVVEVIESLELDNRVLKDRIFYECNSILPNALIRGHNVALPTEKDFDEIAVMIDAFRHEEWPGSKPKGLEETRIEVASSAQRGSILVLKVNDEIKSVCKMTNGDASSEVTTIFTKTNERGNGYGYALLVEATRLALQKNDRCYLMSDAQNPASNHVFKKVGYRPIYEYIDLMVTDSLEENSCG